jgi:hypothetical protein
VTTERRPDDELPEHERRPETDDRPVKHADPESIVQDQPTSDIDDADPEDPNGPEAAYQPRSI